MILHHKSKGLRLLQNQNSLTLSGITFGYAPETPVVRNITFDVVAGQSVALLGANGSGKSTLLKLFNGSTLR